MGLRYGPLAIVGLYVWIDTRETVLPTSSCGLNVDVAGSNQATTAANKRVAPTPRTRGCGEHRRKAVGPPEVCRRDVCVVVTNRLDDAPASQL
jgi:hypothetical protein